MRRSLRFLFVALACSACAMSVMSSCASSAKAAQPAATAAAPAAPPAAQATKAAPSDAAAGAASKVPEVSFPYRRPPSSRLIVASLHEPALPAIKAAKAAEASAPAASAVVTPSTPAAAAVEAPAATAPTAAQKKAETPLKANVPKVASPSAAPKSATADTKAKAKEAAKEKAPEPKNAPSTAALSVTSDSELGKKPDIPRNFSAVVGTRFEVPFEGTGWTYLGEKTLKEGIAYDSRRFEGTSLVFILNPTKAGDYILRFQRQDALRGLSYEELVGVSVSPKPEKAQTVAAVATNPAAPSSAAATNSAATPATSAPASTTVAAPPMSLSATNAAAVTTASTPAIASTPATAAPPAAAASSPLSASSLSTPEAALVEARAELQAGKPNLAIEALDRLIVLAPEGNDEGYILYARALENKGPQKDIKRAYAYYKKIRDEYPESRFWEEAAARADYIERHYFDIR
jgi:trimeric autotransporter adhesin